MARPRGFDIDQAVDRAMDLFWRRGYTATSLQDMTAELGVGSGSLYAAFGSKDTLYALALERYCSQETPAVIERIRSAPEVKPAIRELLTGMAETDLADPERGCLLVNAATERGNDPATVHRVSTAMRQVESALTDALTDAQTRGELSADKDPAALASFLTTFIQGLRVVGQARSSRAFVGNAVATALHVLD